MPFKLEVVADVGEEVWFIHTTTRKAAVGVVKGIEVNRLPANTGSKAPVHTHVTLDVLHLYKSSGMDGSRHNVDGNAAFLTKEALLASL